MHGGRALWLRKESGLETPLIAVLRESPSSSAFSVVPREEQRGGTTEYRRLTEIPGAVTVWFQEEIPPRDHLDRSSPWLSG